MGYLSEDKRSIYNYGFFTLIGYLITIIIILISGYFNKIVCESIIFLICCMSFRVNIGGFHFTSSKVCSIVSYISFAMIPFFIKRFAISINFALISILAINTYIWIVAPIESSSKKLSTRAKLRLKERIKKLMIFWTSFVVLLYYLNMINFILSLFFSYWCCLILLLSKQFHTRGEII